MGQATGFLHPGAMGSAIAASCRGERLWASDGRSAATRDRADEAGLTDVGSLAELVERADVIVSVCPPDQALAVAEGIAALGFAGVYVDANAIAPSRSASIELLFERYVDGGIIGPPPRHAGTTRMYLSGEEAASVAPLWSDSPLDVRAIEGGAGAASAVKMCFAAWTKGQSALLLNINALAAVSGVTDVLADEWATSMPGNAQQSERTAQRTAPKAWRFAGEMREIATAFADVGLPHEFHLGAADLYARLAQFKDTPAPGLDDVIAALTRSGER